MADLQDGDVMLLEAYSCALSGKKLPWTSMPNRKKWSQIYRAAQEHKVFPMIMETVCKSSFFAEDPVLQSEYRFFLKRSEAEIYTQAQRSADFLLLYDYLLKRGLKPLVMKGIVCRSLYPNPEHRPSSDEDLLIDPQEFRAYHHAMLDYGMELVDPAEDIEQAYEVAYQCKETLLFIEIHKYMFPPDSQIFGSWNRYFDRSVNNRMKLRIYGCSLYTLNPDSHLLYLILHTFKHFLYGGFGIRQISDIVLFMRANADRIKWDTLEQILLEVHAADFVKAIYKISMLYLWDDLPAGKLFPNGDYSDIDELPLLCDVMSGGVYGASSAARQHSSNMTLYAMRQKKTDRGSQSKAVLHSVLLPRKDLEKKYRYLKKAPFLLPLAWTQRALRYMMRQQKHRVHHGETNQTKKSIQLGNQRIELLRQYNIIQE